MKPDPAAEAAARRVAWDRLWQLLLSETNADEPRSEEAEAPPESTPSAAEPDADGAV
jgi:hypothetical protein